MKFKEQFPSLEGKEIETDFDGRLDWDVTLVNIHDIKEHCFDKQKVREVIDKMLENLHPLHHMPLLDMKKDLGL